MTCIVGIETPQGVMLGADSISGDTGSWTCWTADVPKLFRLGQYVLGFTSSWRMGDLLRHQLRLAPPPATRVHRHMVVAVVPAIRACLKEGGFATTKDGAEVGGFFLIGTNGQLFQIGSDYQVNRSTHGYNAVGVGRDIALGALAATERGAPRRRLRLALEAAGKHCMGVRGPWCFLAESGR
jgi:hypothetical protein